MTQLTFSLFGPTEIGYQGEVLSSLRTLKVQALLAYLVVEGDREHRREELTALLWPGMPERSARHNLRQVVYFVRQAFPEVASKSNDQPVRLLQTNRASIQLHPDADVNADVVEFAMLLQHTQEHGHIDRESCATCRENLEAAVALYRGDFMADFYLDDSDEFEAWSQARRGAYRRQMLDALETLTTMHIRLGEYPQARRYVEQQLDIDNLRESAYRQLMEILALSDHRQEALAQYEECRRILADELGMAPSARTTALYEQIKAGDLHVDEQVFQGVRGYELQNEIGKGAYGTVHLALQPAIGRQVAVKVIREKYADDPEFILRFEAEAQMVARLEHPNIVPLYDYWRDPTGAYLIMRYLQGGSLLNALEGGPWDLAPTIKLVEQMASALSLAHHQGIVHRDIKPANILLDQSGNAYLTDFGIAKDMIGQMGMTMDGALMGTPDYISPEQIKSDDIGPPSDIYSLGAVLYEMLAGEKPFPDSSVANLFYQHLNEPVPLVASSRRNLPVLVDEVIQRATAKDPSDRYQDALLMAEALQLATIGESTAGGITFTPLPGVDIVNPYKGLRAFQESEANDFFGRDALVQQLVTRLSPLTGGRTGDGERFMAVVGPSGSGKSSVIKAGLIPALREGIIPGSDRWYMAEMAPGTHPLEELELALWPIAVDPPASLVEPMQHDVRGILRTIRRILPGGEDGKLLLIIDQFEELFTLVEDQERRDFFIESLLLALNAPNSPLRILVTLRADFYDRPLQIQSLGQLVKDGTEIVLPMTAEELTWAVREPAHNNGVRLEDGLAEAIVADVGDQPGALPLMQYALTELFEMRQNGTMTLEAYRDIDGVSGALSRRADEIYNDLDEAGQEAARQLFLRLVTLGEGVQDTRRRVLRAELEALHNEDMTAVIDALGAARLLTFDRDPQTRAATVEVAHEALLREWPRLREWLDENRNDVRLERMLAATVVEWQAAEEVDGYLLRDGRLDQFENWAEESDMALTPDEERFLQASLAARGVREAEEEARRQRELETAQQLAETERARAEEQKDAAAGLRRRAYILGGVMGIALMLAAAAFFFADQSGRNAQAAEQNAFAAQQSAQLASTREAEALAEAQSRATSEANADQQRDAALEAEAEAEEARQAAADAAAAEAAAAGEARAAQATAEEEARQRATAEAQAIVERQVAEQQAGLARSRELAAQSARHLEIDPELAILLAREALTTESTFEASNALHAAILGSRLRGRLPAHQAHINGIAHSPDGELMVTTSDEETAKVWRVVDNELLFETPINIVNGGVHLQASFSPDGARLMTVDPGEEFSLAIWDTDTWRRLETIELPIGTAGMTTYSISSDLSQAAVGYEDGAASSWDLGSREQLANLPGHDGWVEPFYSPDGSLLATYSSDGNAGKVIIWNPVAGTSDKQVNFSGSITFITLSPDNRWLAAGSGDEILLWDLAELAGENKPPHAVLRGHGFGIGALIFTPDSQQLATGGRDQTARIWDVTSGQELVTLGHDTSVGYLAFTPDGSQLVAGDDRGDLRFWDLTTTGASELSSTAMGDVNYADLSPDGNLLATGQFDGVGKLWDLETGQEVQAFEGHDDTIMVVDYHPQEQKIATASMDGSARVWDMLTGEELLRLEGHDVGGGFFRGVLGLDYSPDGRIIATSGADGKVRTWDATTGEALLLLDEDEEEEWVTRVAFSPDGSMLATGGELSDITISDTQSGQELISFPAAFPARDIIWGLEFTPDSRVLAVSGTGGLSKLWAIDKENARSQLLAALPGHTSIVFRLDLSSDGQLLATSGGGDTRVWDLSKIDEVEPGEPVPTSLIVPGVNPRFNLDGDELLTLNGGFLQAYTLDNERLLELAESRVTREFSAEECARFNIDPCPGEG